MATVRLDKTINITSKDEGDHVYFNINIRKNEKNGGRAVFDENRVDAILQNPADYDLAVVRFSVPGENIPIFLWVDNKFSVSLEYNGATFTSVLEWHPNFVNNAADDFYGRAVWNYNNFIESINKGLSTAFLLLKAANPASPLSIAPRMVYDGETQLNSLFK